jgi:steroid 5-alpha reductase family enzyme
MFGYAANPGDAWWTAMGPLNILALFVFYSISATEERMMKGWSEDRKVLYRDYKRVTSSFIPFFVLGKREKKTE